LLPFVVEQNQGSTLEFQPGMLLADVEPNNKAKTPGIRPFMVDRDRSIFAKVETEAQRHKNAFLIAYQGLIV
jgi:hypothetical protein